VDKKKAETITLRFYQMMAHAFSRDLSEDELSKFRRAESKFDEAMKSFPPKVMNSFMDMGRAAYQAEKERLEQQQQKAA